MSPTKKDYADKRSFDRTPEPPATWRGNVDVSVAKPGKTFIVHQHHATRLHFDLRLEMMNGDTPVLVSWAVPKNMPRRRGKPHLAIHVEDHPFDYGSFSGTIPAGNYGAGEVRIFDSGTYEVLEQEDGKLTFELHGERLRGIYHMHRTSDAGDKEEWLTFLKKDLRPDIEELPLLKPMLATLADDAFDDPDWLFEPKWDGVRTLAVCGDETRLLSRNGNDVTHTYPELDRIKDQLVAIDAVVDGEVVAFEKERPSFEKLQSRINLQNVRDIKRATKSCPVTYIAFDVLYLDGRRLCDLPIEERKAILEDLVVPNQRIQVSPSIPGEGIALADAMEQRGFEGIVAKKTGTPYRPGKRTKDWLKIKVVHDADVVIGGWTPGEGARSSSFGALLVGAFADDGLHFLGSVGTGFDDKTLRAILKELEEIESDECPFVETKAGLRAGRFGKPIRDPRWVRPELATRVEFREVTSAPRLRAPSFKGLRKDKAAQECLLADIEALRH